MSTMKLKVVNSTIFLLALVSYGENASARFIESDPIGLNGGINTYAYAKENPLRYTDPFGLSPRDVAAITDNFLKNVVQMTNDGYRLQNGKLSQVE